MSSAGSLWRRLVRGGRRLYARADWLRVAGADWADRVMAADMTDDYHTKQGRSTGRWLLDRDSERLAVYLKRHYRLPWWDGLRAALWPGGDWSPALLEVRHLEWAKAHGIPVPEVVAAGEFLRPGGRLQSVLVIESLEGMIALHKAIPLASRTLPPAAFRRWKAGLTRELARLAFYLHDRRYFHKDLYLCHFFIPRADIDTPPSLWAGRVHVIDLHRLTHHPMAWPYWIVKDLGGFLYSSEVVGVDARDRLRFWRSYLGPIRHARRGRLLKWFVRLKGGRYRDHNTKRRAAKRAA